MHGLEFCSLMNIAPEPFLDSLLSFFSEVQMPEQPSTSRLFLQQVRGYSAEVSTLLVGISYGVGVLGYIGASFVGEFVTTRRNTVVIWTWVGSVCCSCFSMAKPHLLYGSYLVFVNGHFLLWHICSSHYFHC